MTEPEARLVLRRVYLAMSPAERRQWSFEFNKELAHAAAIHDAFKEEAKPDKPYLRRVK